LHAEKTELFLRDKVEIATALNGFSTFLSLKADFSGIWLLLAYLPLRGGGENRYQKIILLTRAPRLPCDLRDSAVSTAISLAEV
jgi:hypothetical protein